MRALLNIVQPGLAEESIFLEKAFWLGRIPTWPSILPLTLIVTSSSTLTVRSRSSYVRPDLISNTPRVVGFFGFNWDNAHNTNYNNYLNGNGGSPTSPPHSSPPTSPTTTPTGPTVSKRWLVCRIYEMLTSFQGYRYSIRLYCRWCWTWRYHSCRPSL